MKNKLVIIGAGGAGLEALMVARDTLGVAWDVAGFIDDDSTLAGQSIDGIPVWGGLDACLPQMVEENVFYHCAIGRNEIRQHVVEKLSIVCLRPATLIHSTAKVAASAVVGEGSYLAPFVFVGPEAKVGRHVLINVAASVGHHTVIHDFAQICPGARISGTVELGVASFVGSNGVVSPGLKVGPRSRVAAASFVARDVGEDMTAIGVPAKVLAASKNTV